MNFPGLPLVATILLTAFPISTHAAYEWQPWPGGTEAALFLNGRQIGSWDALGGYYRSLRSDGSWGPRESIPPIPPPQPNFGIDETRLSSSPRYCLNGKEVNLQAIQRAISDAKIPDLSSRLRLTVIGAESAMRPVVNDLSSHPDLARFKSELITAFYEPTHWHVANSGYVTNGQPTIYVQDSKGKVLHRQDDYSGGAKSLAETLGKLRNPRPDYTPTRDPDQRGTPAVPKSLIILAGLGAAGWLLTRRKTP